MTDTQRRKRGFLAMLLAIALTAAFPLGVLADADGLDEDPFQQQEVEEITAEDAGEEEQQAAVASKPVSGSPQAAVLNAAELSPVRPRSEALGALLDELLPTIVSEDMDTYEQVKACYDYLVTNVSYGSHMKNLNTPVANGVTCARIYGDYGELEGFGAVALTAKKGMCNAYASAFILMTRELGLNAYLVKGSTRRSGGAYTHHEWAEVKVGDKVYLFDPQLEQNLRASGLPAYSVFCVTYDQVPGRYTK